MATTYRAAYIPAERGSNGVGTVLTGPQHADLPDDELMELAYDEAEAIGAVGNIEIGDWTE